MIRKHDGLNFEGLETASGKGVFSTHERSSHGGYMVFGCMKRSMHSVSPELNSLAVETHVDLKCLGRPGFKRRVMVDIVCGLWKLLVLAIIYICLLICEQDSFGTLGPGSRTDQ